MARQRLRAFARYSGGGAKLWGNQITQGYLTQRRDIGGKFATSSQASAFKSKVKRARNYSQAPTGKKGRVLATAPAVSSVPTSSLRAGTTGQALAKIGVGGGSLATALTLIKLGSAISPSFDFSRKHFRIGIKPSISLGKNFKLSTSHSIGIERTTPDFYDRAIDSATGSVSKAVRSALSDSDSGKAVGDVVDNVLGRKRDISINGIKIKNTDVNQPRRWRYQASESENISPPGAPAVKKRKAPRKPQGSRGRKASPTITNTVKRQPGGVVPRGKKGKKKSQKARIY